MSETPTFDIVRVILCDYASQDVNGKIFALGIVSPQIFFEKAPKMSVPFHLIVTVMPRYQKFKFDLEFSDPSETTFFKAVCEYENDLTPGNFEQCNYLLQLPQVAFRGFGNYRLKALEDGAVLQEWFLNVSQGRPALPTARIGYRTFGVPA